MIDDIGLRIAERDAPRAFHDTAPAPLKTIFPTAVTHHITGGRCGHLGDGPHNKPVSRAGRAGSAPGGAQFAFAAKGRAGFGYSTQPRWRRAGSICSPSMISNREAQAGPNPTSSARFFRF